MAGTRILGIETSCDETAASVVERHSDGSGTILADVVLSQLEDHAAYGGVVPEIAARAHAEALDKLIAEALRRADTKLEDVDAIAATSGPGLIGGLIVGLLTGKAIAMATGKPIFCEKPLCRTAEELKELAPLISSYSNLFAVGFVRRYSAGGIKLLELVKAGKIGKPICCSIECLVGGWKRVWGD